MPKEVKPRIVIVYADKNGREPFTEWLDNLKDVKAKRKIALRITRVQAGLYGDYKPVGEGVLELRVDFGPGYRVYFGEKSGVTVVLLCGGDKSSQNKDITMAQKYWREYHHENL